MLLSDFHCKENVITTGAAHLIQTFLTKNRLLWFARLLTLLISGDIAKKSEPSAPLQLFQHFPYNENLTRALNTTSIKCCLPSTLPLQLMKATDLAESYNYLSIFIVICLLQRCLLTVAR